MDRLRYQRQKSNLLHSRTAGRPLYTHLQCRKGSMEVWGWGGGGSGGRNHADYVCIGYYAAHSTHSPSTPGARRALTEGQSLQTTVEHSCAFIAPPTHSLFILHFLSEFIVSFMFKSIPVESRQNRAAACSWVIFRPRSVVLHPYASTGSQRAGRSASNAPCKHVDGAGKKNNNCDQTGRLLIKKSTCDAHPLIRTGSLAEPNSLIPTKFVFINFSALSKLMTSNSTLTAAGADSLPSWPLQA